MESASTPSAGSDAQISKILIVDDDEFDICVMEGLLANSGFPNVISTTDPTQALDLIQRERPNLILLDVLMPGLSGLELLGQIRAHHEYGTVPIVVVTASDDRETKARAMQLGACDFLAKPVDPTELVPRARNALLAKAYYDELNGRARQLEEGVARRTAQLVENNESLRAEIAERRRVEEALRLEESRLEALLELGRMAEASITRITDFALEKGVQLTKSEFGYLAFANEDESILNVHAWSKTAMERCGIENKQVTYPVDKTGLWGEAVRQRRPVITNDYAAPNPRKGGIPKGHVPLVRHMTVPVLDGKRIVAVAGVANKEEDYDESDVRQLTLLMRGMWSLLEHKRKEQALQESEEKYRALAENTNDLPYHMSPEGILVYVGPQVKRYGFSPEEVIGQSFLDFISSEDRNRTLEQVSQAIATGDEFPSEFRILGKDGSTHWVEDHGKVQYDESGNVTGIAGILRDVSERKAAEEALRQREELLRATLESTGDGILVTDDLSNVTHWNSRFVQMWRIPKEVLKTHDDYQWIAYALDQLEDADAFCDRVDQVRASSEQSFDTIPCRDGRVFERSSSPLIRNGEVAGRVWVFRDVTRQEQAEQTLREKEEELRQKQKLEAVGELAGGIAHEFNNLLQAISGYTSYAMEGLAADDQRYLDLEQVAKAAARAAALTRQLLGFSRRQVLEPRNVDPNEALADLAKMIRPVIGEHIQLEISYGDDTGNVLADPGQLQEVLLNLCLNARDAMPGGGKLTLRTAGATLGPDFCARYQDLEPGPYVVLSVSDTGCGMTDHVRERIFEPFFTTKEVGKGTGLGLSRVYGIIRQHGGAIHVATEPGKGSTFKIYLPAAQGTTEPGVRAESAPAAGDGELILVAEDEPMVRDLTVRVLEEAGYRTLAARDGEEALHLFGEHSHEVGLVLLDAVMPKLSGHEVYRRIQSECPDAKVVFCSGYDPETAPSGPIQSENVPLLQKPVEPAVLLKTVGQMLSEVEPCLIGPEPR